MEKSRKKIPEEWSWLHEDLVALGAALAGRGGNAASPARSGGAFHLERVSVTPGGPHFRILDADNRVMAVSWTEERANIVLDLMNGCADRTPAGR